MPLWIDKAIAAAIDDSSNPDDALGRHTRDRVSMRLLAMLPAEALYDAVLATIILKAYEFTDDAEVTPQQVARAIVESIRRVLER